MKNWRAGLWPCLEDLGASWGGSQLVPIFSWLVLCSCQNPSSRGFRLGSLKHRDLTLLITYGKLALTCFCAVEYGKGGKISKWNCDEWGCGRGSSPRGAGSPELEKEHAGYKWIDWGSSHCIVKEALKKPAQSDLSWLFPRWQPPSAEQLLTPCLTLGIFLHQ